MNIMAPAQVKSLLIIASQLSGYPIPADPLPPVEIVNAREMAKDGCEDETRPCGIIGFFEFKTGNIEILNDPSAGHSINTITVHELTHWLQFHNWPNPESRACPREYLREYQAYLAGYKYEVTYEGKTVEEFQTPGVVCDMP